MSATGAALEFGACQERLERAVAGSCALQTEWRSAATAGVYAALEFAAADPAAALVLTEHPTERWREREPEFVALVERLAALLGHSAPPPTPRLPGGELVVLLIVRQVNLKLTTGRAGQIMELAPDLAFLALMPYIGFAEARRCAQLTATA